MSIDFIVTSEMAWKRSSWWCGFVCSVFFVIDSLYGHPVSLTTANVQVAQNAVSVSLEVLWEDLVLFHQLQPDSTARFESTEISRAAVSHREFLRERLILLNGNGETLPVSLGETLSGGARDEWVPQEDLMRHRVTYELRFTSENPLETLTIVQRFGAGEIVVPAIMDLSVRCGDRWLHPPTQLMSDQPLTIAIGEELVRKNEESQWEAIQRQKQADAVSRLGLGSYSALYSFIYVNDDEVRHEVLVPLQTLDQWLPVSRADPDRLTVEEQERAVEPIRDFFRQRSSIRLNGVVVPSHQERIRFIGVDVRDLARLAPAKDLSAYQTRVGIQLRYPVTGRLREVEIPWSIYGENAAAVQSTVFIPDEAPSRFRFWKGGKAWRWQREIEETDEPSVAAVVVPTVQTFHIPVLSVGILVLTFGGSILFSRRSSVPLSRVCFILLMGMTLSVLVWPLGPIKWSRLPAQTKFSTNDEGRAVSEALIQLIYSSFNETQSELAYDGLDAAVSGDLLEELFLELREGLIFQEQGGAVPRVEQIEWLAYEASPLAWGTQGGLEFSFRGEWSVLGSVEHWGHLHQRHHRYRADVVVADVGGHWRITNLGVLEQSRGATNTSLRRVGVGGN